MERNKELIGIFRNIGDGRLPLAMEMLESFGSRYPELSLDEAMAGIKDDYRRMADYWADGYRDPQFTEIYAGLGRRLYRLTADTLLRHEIARSPYLSAAARRIMASHRDWSPDVLRAGLEGFVSDVAMLELEPPHTREARQAGIYGRHQKLMSDLFDYLWLSGQWADGVAESFRELLLLPTVDSADQQLMVSAVTLSLMNIFDIRKFRLLAGLYRDSSDENVRQRALVGMVFSFAAGRESCQEEFSSLVQELLGDERMCRELTELQIQLIYCVSAESDNRTIQKEIMPDLLKHNNLSITRFGIEENEEDSMEEILNPEVSERNMEKVEEGFRRMIDMQKAGSDIYFGGFSQMKRFPFFDNISNWFVPFYPEHPAVASLYDSDKDRNIVRTIIDNGPFCNSDKYSFVLAFKQVMDRIPQSMREMIGRGEAVGMGRMMDADRQSAAYIRRIYLQDVYRFFRLFPSRSLFRNPFDYRHSEGWDSGYMFFADTLVSGTELGGRYDEIVAFLVGRKMYREAAEVLDNWPDGRHGYNYFMFCGNVLMHSDETIMHDHLAGKTAEWCFGRALELRPDDRKALAGYARACFRASRMGDALGAYDRLLGQEPGKKSLLMGRSVCLVKMGEFQEALKTLFQLDYEYPGDAGVRRVLAHALVGAGKYEQARKIYVELTGVETPVPDDFVGYGYCEWLSGNRRAAARLFARYLKMTSPGMTVSQYRDGGAGDIMREGIMLTSRHIKEGLMGTGDMQLMADLICNELFS